MFARTFSLFDTRRLLAAGVTVGMLSAVLGTAVAAMALTARTAVGAGGPGCFSTGPVCTVKGNAASSDFGSVSTDRCVLTDAFVNAFDSVTAPNRASTKTVFVFISKYNICTETPLLSVSNFDPTTGISVFNGTSQIATNLNTATVTGSAPMFDNYTGAQLFTSTINVTWQGFGATSTFIDSSHMRMAGFLMNSHFHGTSRAAVASGVITDESGSNLAALQTPYGTLQNSSNGTVQLSHS